MSRITLKALQHAHFPLLLKWLETQHVKAWWDPDVHWTMEKIHQKYDSYVQGYKLEEGLSKLIKAFIIYQSDTPIGYIQLYNAHDFPRSMPLHEMPEHLAAFDVFIGVVDYLNKGLASCALLALLQLDSVKSFTHAFVDPDTANIAAIKAYEKAGFNIVKKFPSEVWMLKSLRDI